MNLTPEQLSTLAADIAADPALAPLPHNEDSADAIITLYNQQAVPDFWVWRTLLMEQEVYEAVVDGLKWSWATYKAQTVQDRDAWQTSWHPGQVNPSLAQTREGWLAIFGGQGASQVQVNYLLALGRRRATRIEDLFALGSTSTPANPATMGAEGDLTIANVMAAWATGA